MKKRGLRRKRKIKKQKNKSRKDWQEKQLGRGNRMR